MANKSRIQESPATAAARQVWEEAKQVTDAAEIEMRKSWFETESQDRVVQETKIDVGWYDDGRPRGGEFWGARVALDVMAGFAQQQMIEWIRARGLEAKARAEWDRCIGEDFIRLSDSLSIPLDDWESIKKKVDESGIDVQEGRILSQEIEIAGFSNSFAKNRDLRRFGKIALIAFVFFVIVGKQTVMRLGVELGLAIIFLVAIYTNRTKRDGIWLEEMLQNPSFSTEITSMKRTKKSRKSTK